MSLVNGIQLFTLFILAVTVILMARQLSYSSIDSRLGKFNSINSPITEHEIEVFLLHLKDNFDEKIYEKYYHNNPLRIKSYILMKRKYIYLLMAIDLEGAHRRSVKKSAEVWISELMEYKEFRHVHVRMQGYYKKLSKIVAKYANKESKTSWMCDSYPLICTKLS